MKLMQRKCSFIKWRDSVEEVKQKIDRDDKITVESLG